MRNSLIAASAWVLLAVIFAIDAITPQGLVVAILLSIPIALAALTRNRHLVFGMSLTALICDAGAGLINMRQAGQWDPIGVSDRLFSAFSIILVGYLSTEVQERSQRLGVVMAREERMRREVSLASSVERLRLLLSRELVARGLVREAVLLFAVDGASWISISRDEPVLTVDRRHIDVIDEHAAEGTEIVSLVHNALAEKLPRRITSDDAFGRLLLARFTRRSAIAFPVFEGETPHGVIVLWSNTENVINEDDVLTARIFARALGNVLGRAELFAELAHRNAEIDERNAVIRDLVYALAHDLRTPLTALGMTMRQANEGAFGALPPAYAKILSASIAAIDDLQRLAETLLTVARIESGESRTMRETIDLHRVVSEVVTECDTLARSREVSLSAKTEEAAMISGDRGDIRRAITNLVANALEHTPAHGHVEIRLEQSGGSVLLHVLDDGYGIPPDVQPSLFERFSSAAGSGVHGTGLGLYIVRRIVEAAAGKVLYTARSPRGSIFTLSFPKVTV